MRAGPSVVEVVEWSSVICKKLFTTFSFAVHSLTTLSLTIQFLCQSSTSLVVTTSLPCLTCPNYPLSLLPYSSLISSSSNHNTLFCAILLGTYLTTSSLPCPMLSFLRSTCLALTLLAPHLLFFPQFTLTVPSCPSPHFTFTVLSYSSPHFTLTVPSCSSPHSPIPPLSPCPPRWLSKTACRHHPLQSPWWPTLELVHTLNRAAGATLHRPPLT